MNVNFVYKYIINYINVLVLCKLIFKIDLKNLYLIE